MRRAFVVGLFVLAFVSIGAPYIAFNQELLPMPDMAAPVALLTFGFLGLVGGVAGYFWRYRPKSPETPGRSPRSWDFPQE